MKVRTQHKRRRPTTNRRPGGKVGRVDPSRTTTLRRWFEQKVSAQFARLRTQVVHFVLYGGILTPADNASISAEADDVSFPQDMPSAEGEVYNLVAESTGTGGLAPNEQVNVGIQSTPAEGRDSPAYSPPLDQPPLHNANPYHDTTGRFTSAATAAFGSLSKLEEHARGKLAQLAEHLPKPVQTVGKIAGKYVLGHALKIVMSSFTAGQALAERTAKERGLSDQQAHQLRVALAAADLVLSKPAALVGHMTGLGAAVGFVPIASAAYLFGSTATNPVATLRAAHDLISEQLPKTSGASHKPGQHFRPQVTELVRHAATSRQREQVSVRTAAALCSALERHDFSDWHLALLCAALDHGLPLATAISTAEAAYTARPEPPQATANVNPYHDEKGRFTSSEGAEPSDRVMSLLNGDTSLSFKTVESLEDEFKLGKQLWRGEAAVKKDKPFASDPGDFGRGVYYSTSGVRARCYGSVCKQHEVTLKKPLVLTMDEAYELADHYETVSLKKSSVERIVAAGGKNQEIQQQRLVNAGRMSEHLMAAGYDGLVAVRQSEGHGELEVVAFRKPTTNAPYAFHSSPYRIRLFQKWLQGQVEQEITGLRSKALWNKYIEDGYKKGAGRSYDDYTKRHRAAASAADTTTGTSERMSYYRGGRDSFLQSSFNQPASIEEVQLLSGRTFDDLEGITRDMSLRMSRSLTDSLVQGKSPREAARLLANEVDLGKKRALTIARTELIRAHAEGQLTALENLGAKEVGVEVEWSTATNPCPECAAMAGNVMSIEEARGQIPLHPNCRCVWIPANVGEVRNQLLVNLAYSQRLPFSGLAERVLNRRLRFITNDGGIHADLPLKPTHNANPYHDEKGRFTSAGGDSGSDTQRSPHADNPRIFRKPEDVKEVKVGWGSDDIRHGWKDQPGTLLTGRPLKDEEIPDTLYHVTTAGPAVRSSGVLLGQKNDSGLGGGQEEGVSFTTSHQDAQLIHREITRSVKIARGEITYEDLPKLAREDESIAGLPQGALDKAVAATKPGHDIAVSKEQMAHFSDHPGYLESVMKDAYNQYLFARESAAAKHSAEAGDILKNPILFGNQKALRNVNPVHIEILTIHKSQIPKEALVTTGSDDFLHEVRAYSDVPVHH